MENDFDPYYKWLGIPPRDQPPNHYRLLGIELFESDRDVIDAAANRIMSYLKDLAIGDEAQHSQKLLNEVARARLCLLNRQKKVDYDAELGSKIALDLKEDVASPPAFKADTPGEPPGPPPSPPPLAPSPSPGVAALNLRIQDASKRTGRRPSRAANSDESSDSSAAKPVVAMVAMVAVAALLLIGVGLGAVFLLGGGEDRDVAQTELDASLPSWPDWPPVEEPPIGRKKDRPERQPEPQPVTQPKQPTAVPTDAADQTDPDLLDPRMPADGPDPLASDDSTPSPIPGLPKLPDWSDVDEGGVGPVDGAGTSGLPERQDFVDPGSMQETPDQETPKADPRPKVTPAEPSEPKTVPRVPDGTSPFRDLPQMVALPPVEDASVSPVVLGPVHLQESEPCFVQLRGGDAAVRGSQSFALRNADGQTAEREWEILLRDGDNQSKLAHLGIEPDGRLVFRWEAAAQTNEIASNLGNCALVLSAPGKPTHMIALRQPVQSESLVIDLERPNPKSDLRIDSLPDPSTLHMEIIGVGGSDFQVKPAAVLAFDKGEAWLTIEDAGGLLVLKMVLKVETGVRRGIISVEVGPHFQRVETAKPETFVVKRFPQVINEANKYGQNLQVGIKNATQALTRNPTSSQRQALQQTLAAMQQEEKDFQDFLLRLNQLHTFLDTHKNKIELQLRVYCAADSSEIDLFVAGGPADEPQ